MIPIGTLVMLVRARCHRECIGTTGVVTKHFTPPIGGSDDHGWTARDGQLWSSPRSHLMPLTPPPRTTDEPQREPTEETA
jgi:hypothetical protein